VRRIVARRRGRAFVAAGISKRHGPYVVGTYRLKKVGTVKATAGSKGVTLGLKRNVLGRKVEAGYNFTTKTFYAKQARKRRR
jgi:hypothetical protein